MSYNFLFDVVPIGHHSNGSSSTFTNDIFCEVFVKKSVLFPFAFVIAYEKQWQTRLLIDKSQLKKKKNII